MSFSVGPCLQHALLVLAMGLPMAAAAEPAAMRPITSSELAAQMGVGWNLGNSLEAIGGETNWGNPAATPALLRAVKAAGFKTLRIPVAWKQYANADDVISPGWLDRVQQVVDQAQEAGLHTIINIHWDGGWMQPTFAQQALVTARLTKYWTQIAGRFRDHGDTLLFAGTNEVMKDGDYGPPTAEYCQVQNGFNQAFVNAVRATGGNNAQRHLVVQGFNTNIEHTLSCLVLPSDPANRRLMVEVHYYDPYNFTLNEKSSIWQWGRAAPASEHHEPWADEAHLDDQFDRMKARFADRGVPVILGEYAAIRREEFPGHEAYRLAWVAHVSRAAVRRGFVPVYWDPGATGNHSSGLFDRHSGRQVHGPLVRAIVDAQP